MSDKTNEPTREAHPIAARFPMLPDEQLEILAADIKANGLRQPIVLDADGRIIDGRNRLAACEHAGMEPRFVTYEGDDVAAFIVSANVHRRHMTTGARAMATAMVLADAGLRKDGRWVRGAIPAANGDISNSAWAKAMTEAGQLLDLDPGLADQVISGAATLSWALSEVLRVNEWEVQARTEAKAEALDFADGDEVLADRIVAAYLNLRHSPRDAWHDVGDVAENLDYWELGPKARRAADKAKREQQQAEREAAEAAEWDALSDDEKQTREAEKRERSRTSFLGMRRLMMGEVDPEDEIRDLIAAIDSTVGQLAHSYERLKVYTGLPADELRAEITAKLVERQMPEHSIELLWLLLDIEP